MTTQFQRLDNNSLKSSKNQLNVSSRNKKRFEKAGGVADNAFLAAMFGLTGATGVYVILEMFVQFPLQSVSVGAMTLGITFVAYLITKIVPMFLS